MNKFAKFIYCVSLIFSLLNIANATEKKECEIEPVLESAETMGIKQKNPVILIIYITGKYTIYHKDGTTEGPVDWPSPKPKPDPNKPPFGVPFEQKIDGKTDETMTGNDVTIATKKAIIDATLKLLREKLPPACEKHGCK